MNLVPTPDRWQSKTFRTIDKRGSQNTRNMSRVMTKPAFAYAKTKVVVSYTRLCFRYIDITIPLLPKSKISSSVVVQPGLCLTWLETPETCFVMT